MSSPASSGGATALIPVTKEQVESVRKIVDDESNVSVFSEVAQLHFATLSIVQLDDTEGSDFFLLLDTSHNGANVEVLGELWHSDPEFWRHLLGFCCVPKPNTAIDFQALIRANETERGARVVAYSDYSVGYIQAVCEIRDIASKRLQELQERSEHGVGVPKEVCQKLADDEDIASKLAELEQIDHGAKSWLRIFGGDRLLTLVLVVVGFLVSAAFSYMLVDVAGWKNTGWLAYSALLLLLIGWSVISFGLDIARRLGLLFLAAALATVAPFSGEVLLALILLFAIVVLLAAATFSSVPQQASLSAYAKKGCVLITVLLLTLLIANVAPQWLAVTANLFAILILVGLATTFAWSNVYGRYLLAGIVLALLLGPIVPGFVLGVAFLVTACAILVVLSVAVILLRFRKEEERSKPILHEMEIATLAKVLDQETSFERVQNHLLSVTTIRNTRWHRFALRAVLRIVHWRHRLSDQPGVFAGTRTIHFAKWLMVGKAPGYLFFLSNYDGPWNAYLRDFINRFYVALNLVWGHTTGHPSTRWLLWEGALQTDAFLQYARSSQQPHGLFYVAYPRASVREIHEATQLARVLADKERSEESCFEVVRFLL